MPINYNKFKLYHKDLLVSEVEVQGVKVRVKNHVHNWLNPFKAWNDGTMPIGVFTRWIEDRVIPPSRVGIREYLDGIGIKEYNPRVIFNRTHGTMVSDHWWVQFDGEEDMTYDQARDY